MNLEQVRNIGISAHIDSGKTTLSERILYYAGRIHRINEVKGDGDGAFMDNMDLERERGITIASAATSLQWKGTHINLIDTPGHVDFTIEVERSLRVLDGAILVLCGVGGVQSQSLTVDRQMKRYHVPRLAFINKLDRTGANYKKVCNDLKVKLKADVVVMQIPIGQETNHQGVIDLVQMKAYYFEGKEGDEIREAEVPAELLDAAKTARQEMLEALAMYSDELMELLLAEEPISEELIHKVTRSACIESNATPVFMGSAFKNKGVQLLLDAVVKYLPTPLDRAIKAKKYDNPEETFPLVPETDKPFVGMAFKIVDDPFGQLTYTRVYQGRIKKGELYFNQRTGKKERFSRLVRMHSDKREEIDAADAGDIIAVMGIDCASGDTFSSEQNYCSLESMYVPDPVIKQAVIPADRANADKLAKALQRFRKEDPTFQVFTDSETNEVIIAGMGQLHLEIYVERIRREYKVDLEVGDPKVSYRESAGKRVNFDHKRKKQTGGSGQYGHIKGYMEPIEDGVEENFIFESKVVQGRIPKEYIPSIEKGFRAIIDKGPLAEFPVVKLRVVIEDGSYHDVDSSDMAFQLTSQECFREYFPQTSPSILEPIMKVTVECPEHFQGAVTGHIISKRGLVVSSETGSDGIARMTFEVPLAELFSYSGELRNMTQGQGSFEMEFAHYGKTPSNIQKDIIEAKKASQLVGAH
ncbi:MAG TPA: elongation factor G [Pirellulaceae bacterium]|jgi:elongation factor G|nr:elongation factor G [Pirellulaceae bacterium]